MNNVKQFFKVQRIPDYDDLIYGILWSNVISTHWWCLQIRDVLQSRWSLLNHYTLVWCYTSHNFFYAIFLRGQKEMFSNNAEDY